MDDQDRAVLKLAGAQYRHEGNRLNAAREQLGMSGPTFYLRVLHLLNDPEAETEMPTLVHRLRRLRDLRRRNRLAA